MQRKVYSLLVGIDKYASPVPPLEGCVNDIHRINTFLKERFKTTKEIYQPKILINEFATRDTIIQGFKNHLNKATANDVAIFYFGGHGSTEKTPPEFCYLEPDKLNETLVCYDSRQQDGMDLADKELAWLISQLGSNGPHVLIIIDCCHSGGSTRIVGGEVTIRQVKGSTRIRSASSYIVTPEEFKLEESRNSESPWKINGWAGLPKGRYILLSACRNNELAKEISIDGKRTGVFTYYLLDTLERATAASYRNVFARVKTSVEARVSLQSPQIIATHLSDIEQAFFGGPIHTTIPYFTMSYDLKRNNWMIDGGTIHGIENSTKEQKTSLQVFPFDQVLEHRLNLESAIGQIEVQKTFASRSEVSVNIENVKSFEHGLTYKAVVTAHPLAPFIIFLEGTSAELSQLSEFFKKAGPNHQPSPYVRVGNLDNANLKVCIENNNYRVTSIGDNLPLLPDIPIKNVDSTQWITRGVEHIARWTRLIQLTNKLSRLPSGAVQIDIIKISEDGKEEFVVSGSAVVLKYYFKNDRWQNPGFMIRIKNTSSVKLYCVLLDLPETHGIFTLLDGGGVWLEPGQEIYPTNLAGSPLFSANVPDFLYHRGQKKIRDIIKLIASTEEINAALLAQDDISVNLRSTREFGFPNALKQLMYQRETRHFTSRANTEEVLTDWVTSEVSFTTIRP